MKTVTVGRCFSPGFLSFTITFMSFTTILGVIAQMPLNYCRSRQSKNQKAMRNSRAKHGKMSFTITFG